MRFTSAARVVAYSPDQHALSLSRAYRTVRNLALTAAWILLLTGPGCSAR
jgi:hypothetical protein